MQSAHRACARSDKVSARLSGSDECQCDVFWSDQFKRSQTRSIEPWFLVKNQANFTQTIYDAFIILSLDELKIGLSNSGDPSSYFSRDCFLKKLTPCLLSTCAKAIV